MRVRSAALAALLPIAAAVPGGVVCAQAPGAPAPASVYINPVLPHADPSILKWNGEYYLYATGNPIRAYHSTDLVHWREIGPVLSGSTDPDAWNQADVWAPEVVYRNGTFYLYYTASRASEDWRIGEMARRIGVATSDRPEGPFVDSGEPVTPGWGIDGHVFRDPDGGRDYLFYSYLYDPRLPGAGLVVDSLIDPFAVGGRPSHVTRGTEGWEDKDADPNNGSLRYTNEGPTVLKRDGLYYMIYSGGSWDLPTYAMAYAVSDRVMEGGLDGPGWRKVMPPILRSTPLVEAPGHNSVVKAPNNVEDITAYHARAVPFRSAGDRQTFIDRLRWNHDRMYMHAPSLGGLVAPEQPLFADRFDDAGSRLGEGWEAASGSWRVAGGQAQGSGLALVRGEPHAHYVLEANVRIPVSRGAAGVAAYQGREGDRVEVWLDAGRRALVTGGMLAGERIEEEATPLDAAFRFDVYHQLVITKNAGRIEVVLDGVNLQTRELELAAGRVGLLARGGRAEFDGVALAPHYRDAFSGPDGSWSLQGGSWLMDEGALHQGAGGAARYVALKGDTASAYEFSASVRWRDNESVASTAGIVAAATASGEMVLAGFDHTIWPFGRFHVRHVVGGAVVRELSVETPRGFLYDVFHTIAVTKQGDEFTFVLDGREIAAARFPVGAARPGLYTDGVRAAFDDPTWTRIVVPRNHVLNGSFEAERWAPAPASPENPWRLSGGAQVNFCCAHSGQYRLLLTAGESRAEQTVTGLRPGAYTLWAWVTTRDAEAAVSVGPVGGAAARATGSGEAWRRVAIDFEVPAGGGEVVVSVSGRFGGEPGALVAADDFFLFER